MISRRAVLAASAAALLPSAASSQAAMTRLDAHAFSFEGIDSRPIALAEFKGRVVLIVNTASHCAYTRQYRGLQDLWSRFGSRGLVVVGVPANDFGGQEPGSNEAISEFCGREFGITFPMAAKQVVVGSEAHPFYRWAAREKPGETPRWNFHKYLVGRDGRLLAAFGSAVTPTNPRIISAIERALTGDG
jgi:glutathione peroxidase